MIANIERLSKFTTTPFPIADIQHAIDITMNLMNEIDSSFIHTGKLYGQN
jgi:hypothetical protein